MSLKNKKILITAGPTWVPIDTVRVISNTATGQTGILLAQKLQNLGAKVTLLLGGTEPCCLDKGIRLIRFRFFDELKRMILKELKEKKYNIVIHSAAVSDYRPLKSYDYKIKSGRKILRLNLVPTPKIIDLIRKDSPSVFLVGFKFELGIAKYPLIERTKAFSKRLHLNLAVANTINKNRYLAYIVNQHRIYGPVKDKNNLSKKLITVIKKYFNY